MLAPTFRAIPSRSDAATARAARRSQGEAGSPRPTNLLSVPGEGLGVRASATAANTWRASPAERREVLLGSVIVRCRCSSVRVV